MENGPGVHMKFQNAGEAFEEKNEADYLQPAGSGTAAAAYDDKQQNDEFGKGRPLVKVRRYETGGGGQGGSLEQGFPQGSGKDMDCCSTREAVIRRVARTTMKRYTRNSVSS